MSTDYGWGHPVTSEQITQFINFINEMESRAIQQKLADDFREIWQEQWRLSHSD